MSERAEQRRADYWTARALDAERERDEARAEAKREQEPWGSWISGGDELADYFALRPITLWRCDSCGYVDVVRPDNCDCSGCGKTTSGTTHRYRPEPIVYPKPRAFGDTEHE